MRSSLILSTLLLSLPLLTFASPTPQQASQIADGQPTADDPKLSQEEAEAQLRQQFEGEQEAAAAYQDIPIQTSVSPAELAEESSILKYFATASFEDIPYATPDPSNIIDLGVDPTGTGNYYALPKQTDPCGPKVQDGTEFDTCTVDPDGTANTEGSPFVYYTEEPAPYGVQCLPMPANSGEAGAFTNAPTRTTQPLNTTSCDYTSFCASIQPPLNPPKDQWIWNTLGGPGCALAMWLSSDPNAAPLPDKTRCEFGIFRTMALYCEGEAKSNPIAAVNVKQLQGGGKTGMQVNSGYPSYLIAPETLTVL
ncbi:MAG: hypothetical protein Q9213_002059 [Squamulea squamosa]